MTKNDLKDSIINRNSDFYCLVGPNTSGKSHFLTTTFAELKNALFFGEEGRAEISDRRSKVSIQDNEYLYEEDKDRGTDRKIGASSDLISESSTKIINSVRNTLKNINLLHMSLGTKKLQAILDTFLHYNLNNVDYVLLDEPENSLDDSNLKAISRLIDTLIKNGKTVIAVTHSPRLLEIMKVDIGKIYVFSTLFDNNIRNVQFAEVEKKFDLIGEELTLLSNEHPNTISEIDKYLFLPNTELRHCYLTTLLYSYDFYKVLFYRDVYIVEGLTEFYILKEIQDNLPVSNNYFVSGGKYRIPFLISLFSLVCKTVHCFFDTDLDKKAVSFSSSLTKHINDKYHDDAKLYNVDGDVETYLDIDIDKIIKLITNKTGTISTSFHKSFISHYKHYLCYFHICSEPDAKQKVIKLFKEPKDIQYNSYE